jgi:hypothetical protein
MLAFTADYMRTKRVILSNAEVSITVIAYQGY